MAIETHRMPARITMKTKLVRARPQPVGNGTSDVSRKHRQHDRQAAQHSWLPSDSMGGHTRLEAAHRPHARDRAADRHLSALPSMSGANQDASFGHWPDERPATAVTRGLTAATNPDATDWMNHIVQRRITDIAEQFSGSR
ncbi:hypothetical protein BJG93_36130 [Paraburkholderia sprentiae WSM5005]|uniref:Uncharacterized protein n=1 Tax=Paraburkholderia sprentiae WSM5005 TaxID=754502 RepID=A0A8F4KHK3_9BURK|nr:hypothetical protein [Paraburkholderia sprentiae]QXE07254.1 hypothetical protein BJG93_36130 [Paraburkholderia sprentiae WSM5005]